MKYAIKTDGGAYLTLTNNSPFCGLDKAPLFNTQSEALAALQQNVLSTRRNSDYCSQLRLVRVDEVGHAGETKEVRRKFCDAPKEGPVIGTRYEVDKDCPRGNGPVRYKTIDAVVRALTDPAERCDSCGIFTVEAIDTVRLPAYTTRVASELK
jgi:hypothetical protein